MAGYFDFLKDQTSRGYGAYQTDQISPQEMMELYTSRGRTGDNIGAYNPYYGAGKSGVELLAGLAKLLHDKYSKSGKEAARNKKMEKVSLSDIKARAAEIAAKDGLDPDTAMKQAAKEAFAGAAETAPPGSRMGRSGERYRTAVQNTAPSIYQEADKALNEDSAKKGASIYKTYFNRKDGSKIIVDSRNPSEMAPILTAPDDWVPESSLKLRRMVDPKNPEYEIGFYEAPDGTTFPSEQRTKRGSQDINVNLGGDPRTQSQIGMAYGDGLNSIMGYEAAMEFADKVIELADTMPAGMSPTGWPGMVARFGSNVSATAEALAGMMVGMERRPASEAKSARIYGLDEDPENPLSYEELTDPSRYLDVLGRFGKAGLTSTRVQAYLIELAYMQAIATEGSARAISDNDLRLRLQTLGEEASNPATFRALIEDTKDRLTTRFSILSRVEPIFSKDPDLAAKSAAALSKYTRKKVKTAEDEEIDRVIITTKPPTGTR